MYLNENKCLKDVNLQYCVKKECSLVEEKLENIKWVEETICSLQIVLFHYSNSRTLNVAGPKKGRRTTSYGLESIKYEAVRKILELTLRQYENNDIAKSLQERNTNA